MGNYDGGFIVLSTCSCGGSVPFDTGFDRRIDMGRFVSTDNVFVVFDNLEAAENYVHKRHKSGSLKIFMCVYEKSRKRLFVQKYFKLQKRKNKMVRVWKKRKIELVSFSVNVVFAKRIKLIRCVHQQNGLVTSFCNKCKKEKTGIMNNMSIVRQCAAVGDLYCQRLLEKDKAEN
jgi:hypothetical protein